MLTRGYFIGEIVDAFSDISGQVETRGKLGLTDLNIFVEDFFKTALNHILRVSLVNLNVERHNAPGLDLGDTATGWAFQVTSQRTSQKVNETLANISQEQIDRYSHIKVLIIGHKQGSYALNADACARAHFEERNIWDIDDLCKRCMDLPVDLLQTLYNYVNGELTRVKIELEIPNLDGTFPTSMADFVEALPKPTISDLTRFRQYLQSEGIDLSEEQVHNDVTALSKGLANLPRITREFLAIMIERRETVQRRGNWHDDMEINADVLERVVRYPELMGELRLLETYGFVNLNEPADPGESRYWRIRFPKTSEGFAQLIVEYAERNGIPLARPIVNLDFGGY